MNVVTRFAPSPTGFLHIGGARTALFNWLYARHTGGQFRLRIEDTDRARSTEEAKRAILDGLTWLELDWDGEVVFQSSRMTRHAEVATELLAAGHAYRCYCTPQELAEMRENARAEGRQPRYDGRCRDRDPATTSADVAPAIRIKAPRQGETVIDDAVQGTVRVGNEQLDDMIMLRADGTPTYMLSVVVDDHDMGVTHVIRGDDHLTNAFRQNLIYRGLGWTPPVFAHIPLIHGADGAKLSKRHGALGVDAYRDMGFLPEALRNYLLRLGWSHGDDEIIGTEQAIAWFDLPGINKGAARFDMAKLSNLNGHYMRAAESARLVALVVPFLQRAIGHAISASHQSRLITAMESLKKRARTLVELADLAIFYVRERPLPMEPKAAALLDAEGRGMLTALAERMRGIEPWTADACEAAVRGYADEAGIKLGMVAQPLRAALTGRTASPGLFEVMEVLGKDETLGRIGDVAAAVGAV